MRKKLLSIVLLALLAVAAALPASADLLYTRQENYSNTALGLISGTGSPVSPLISNMGGDSGQSITGFSNSDSGYRIGITLYSSSTEGDTVEIYAPGAESGWSAASAWSKPAAEFTSSLINTRGMTAIDGYLYGVAYNNALVNKMSTAGDKYSELATYEFTASEGYTPHGEGIVNYNGSLYAIFSQSKGDYPNYSYLPNTLIKLNADLGVEKSLTLNGLNFNGVAGAYALSGSTLYVVSVGGSQPYGTLNPESQIEAVDLGSMTTKTLVTAQQVQDKDSTFKHFFSAVVPAGDYIYIQAVMWKADYSGYDIRVYQTTADKLAAGDIGTMIKDYTGTGWSSGMRYDPDTKLLWAAAGTALNSFDGTTWKQYDSDALKGSIGVFAIANVPAVPEPSDSGSSSGGCNAGMTGLMLLMALPALFAAKRRTKR